jgi:hypothetical protein
MTKVAPGKNKIHQHAQLWVNRQTTIATVKTAIPTSKIETPFMNRNPSKNRHHCRRCGFPAAEAGSRSDVSFSSNPRIQALSVPDVALGFETVNCRLVPQPPE